jgi:hypothetical protein
LSSTLSDLASDSPEERPKKKAKNAPAAKSSSKPKPKPKTQPKATRAKKATKLASESEEEPVDDTSDQAEDVQDVKNTGPDSESELSILLDEDPKPKKKPRQKSMGSKVSKATKADIDADPDAAEIKRLQGWLIKCGIRKVWGKELKPYDSSKAKIKHLKVMLSDAGMTGRYSVEKAAQIKEARELAADIEEVQAGAERWGAEADEAGKGLEDGAGKPGRRLVRGAKNYDFLSSDGEETD